MKFAIKCKFIVEHYDSQPHDSPMLCGASKCTKPAENNISDTGNETHAKYCTNGSDVRSLYSHTRAEIGNYA